MNFHDLPRSSLNLVLLAVGQLFQIRPHGGRQMFPPVDLDPLRALLRTTLLGLLRFRSSYTFYLQRIPERERQMGTLAAVCTLTVKSVVAENTVTLLVAKHHQLSAQEVCN